MLESAHVFSTAPHFFNAFSYLPYAVMVYICLLFAPALALFPRLTQKPAYFMAVPIISILINVFIAAVLFKSQLYMPLVVQAIAGIFVIIAVFRWQGFSQWQTNDGYIILINLMVVIPLVALGGLSAFMESDALLSWNAWAQYYYYGNAHVVFNSAIGFPGPGSWSAWAQNYGNTTSAPNFLRAAGYPPLFPLLLSYIYKFLGTTDYQGVAKTVLALFPFVVLNSIAVAGKISQKSWLIFTGFIVIAYISLFSPVNYSFYSIGFADPLLAAILALAVFILIAYLDNKDGHDKFDLLLAALLSIAAALSKQPGFLWALFSFPIILIIAIKRQRKLNNAEIFAMLTVAAGALLWIAGPGLFFTHNSGVLVASTGSASLHISTLLSTLGLSIIKYWLKRPDLLLLYIWATMAIYKNPYKNQVSRLVFYFFVIPGTLLWFMLGSYGARLGLQLLSVCAVLISYNNFYPLNKLNKIPMLVSEIKPKIILVCMIILSSVSFIYISYNNMGNNMSYNYSYPLNGPKTIINHYFKQDGEYVYHLLYTHPEKKLWIQNWRIAPLFANNRLISPKDTQNIQAVYDMLMLAKPDYMLMSSPPEFPSDKVLTQIINTCPVLFKEVNLTQQTPPYNFRIYAVVYSDNAQYQCQKDLHEFLLRH